MALEYKENANETYIVNFFPYKVVCGSLHPQFVKKSVIWHGDTLCKKSKLHVNRGRGDIQSVLKSTKNKDSKVTLRIVLSLALAITHFAEMNIVHLGKGIFSI